MHLRARSLLYAPGETAHSLATPKRRRLHLQVPSAYQRQMKRQRTQGDLTVQSHASAQRSDPTEDQRTTAAPLLQLQDVKSRR